MIDPETPEHGANAEYDRKVAAAERFLQSVFREPPNGESTGMPRNSNQTSSSEASLSDLSSFDTAMIEALHRRELQVRQARAGTFQKKIVTSPLSLGGETIVVVSNDVQQKTVAPPAMDIWIRARILPFSGYHDLTSTTDAQPVTGLQTIRGPHETLKPQTIAKTHQSPQGIILPARAAEPFNKPTM